MESLVEAGDISAVMDISPHDIMDSLTGGLMPCYPDRLRPIQKTGIPVVFVPGSLDFILYNGVSQVPEDKKFRSFYKHNEIHTHVRAAHDEMKKAGEFVAERLGGSPKAAVVIPTRGFVKTAQSMTLMRIRALWTLYRRADWMCAKWTHTSMTRYSQNTSCRCLWN